MRPIIPVALTAMLALTFFASGKANSSDEPPWFAAAQEKHKVIMQAIIDGDAQKLATVTKFPIYQDYPLRDIENAEDLARSFDFLFDDSIKNVLRKATLDDWRPMGWRGCMLLNGAYLWTTEEGLLEFITYESSVIKESSLLLRMEEMLNIDEYDGWITHSCFLAQDSSVFLRMDKKDDVDRLHVFTYDEKQNPQQLVFYGTMEYEGSCNNEFYWFACTDSVIDVFISSPFCASKQDLKLISDYIIRFPNLDSLPKLLRGRIIPLQKSFWRDVKKWWYNKE